MRFTDEAVRDPAVLALAAKVRYGSTRTIPIRTTSPATSARVLNDGSVVEERQPHLRGGAHEPLTRADIEEKFALNARHGGWDAARSAAALKLLGEALSTARSILRRCRGK